MSKLIWIIVLEIVLFVYITNGRRYIHNVFHNFTTTTNSGFADINMTIEQNPSRFSFIMDLYQTLHTCFCTLSLNVNTANAKKLESIFDKKYDMCEFFNKPKSEFFMAFVHDELSKAGQWMDSCPIKNKTFAVHNFTLNVEKLPLYTPEVRYNLTIAYTTKKQNQIIDIVRVTVFGKFESTDDVKRRRLAIGKRPKPPTKG